MYKKPLEPEVKEMNIKRSSRYSESNVEVVMDISDGNGGREDVTVKYPIQNDRHLTMLVHDKTGARSFDHAEVQELAAAISKVIPKGE